MSQYDEPQFQSYIPAHKAETLEMPTEIHDWVSNDMPTPLHRSSSSFGEKLTRAKPVQNGDAQPGWQFDGNPIEDTAIPRQTLQKIYLSPPIDVRGDFRNIFVLPRFQISNVRRLTSSSRQTQPL
jgi:hypothetical protein